MTTSRLNIEGQKMEKKPNKTAGCFSNMLLEGTDVNFITHEVMLWKEILNFEEKLSNYY